MFPIRMLSKLSISPLFSMMVLLLVDMLMTARNLSILIFKATILMGFFRLLTLINGLKVWIVAEPTLFTLHSVIKHLISVHISLEMITTGPRDPAVVKPLTKSLSTGRFGLYRKGEVHNAN